MGICGGLPLMGTEASFNKKEASQVPCLALVDGSKTELLAFSLCLWPLKLQEGAALPRDEFCARAAADDFQQQGDAALQRVTALQTCEGHCYISE